MNESDHACWLANQIEGNGEYSAEAAQVLRRQAQRITQLEGMMKNAEPVAYFCDVNILTPEQGKRIERRGNKPPTYGQRLTNDACGRSC